MYTIYDVIAYVMMSLLVFVLICISLSITIDMQSDAKIKAQYRVLNKLSNRIKATQPLISLYKESQRLLVLLENTSDDDVLAIKYLTEEIYKVSMKIKETENE